MNVGFVKVWRSTLDHQLIRNAHTAQLFLWMMLEASWKAERVRGVNLKPGELLSSMPKIQLELHLTEKQVRAAMAILEGLRVIEQDRDFEGRGLGRGKETIYRFINWDKHQSRDHEGRESGSEQGASAGEIRARVELPSLMPQGDSEPKKLKNIRNTTPASDKQRPGREFTDAFFQMHLLKTGLKPSPPTYAYKLADRHAKAIGSDELIRRLQSFFNDPWLTSWPMEKFLGSPDTWTNKRVKADGESQSSRDRKRTAGL